jgi:hypothetical protein
MPKGVPATTTSIAIHQYFVKVWVSNSLHLSSPTLEDFPFAGWTLSRSFCSDLDFWQL